MKLWYSNKLLLLSLVLLLFASCIDEDNSNCVQYSVTPSAVDSTGKAIPAVVKGNLQAYLFINGKFDRIVTSEVDGSFKVSYDGKAGTASLVTIGKTSADSVNVHNPIEGEDIGNMAISVLIDPKSGGYTLPSSLYYGRYDYDSQQARSKPVDTTLVMVNKPIILRVVVKSLKETFGDYSDYSVVISGFRTTMTFSGEITGDPIEYTPEYVYNSSNQLVTDPIRALPTKKGDYVTVSVYRGNNSIWSTALDENGNYVRLKSGEDKVLIVDCGRKTIFMTVKAWDQYTQEIVIP